MKARLKRIDEKVFRSVADDSVPDAAALLFAPLDKRAFGVAIGVASALLVASATIAALLENPGGNGLQLLANYFAGYTVSWPGVAVGAAWAFVVGFIFGWLIAFTRNLSLALSLFFIRSKSELDVATDFLDHI